MTIIFFADTTKSDSFFTLLVVNELFSSVLGVFVHRKKQKAELRHHCHRLNFVSFFHHLHMSVSGTLLFYYFAAFDERTA